MLAINVSADASKFDVEGTVVFVATVFQTKLWCFPNYKHVFFYT